MKDDKQTLVAGRPPEVVAAAHAATGLPDPIIPSSAAPGHAPKPAEAPRGPAPSPRPEADTPVEEIYGPADPRMLAAVALASGHRMKDAAEIAKVHEKTVQRWMRRKPFVMNVSRIRNQAVRAAIGKLSEGMLAAANRLIELVAHTDPHVAWKASVKVLELGGQFESAVHYEDEFADDVESLTAKVDAISAKREERGYRA